MAAAREATEAIERLLRAERRADAEDPFSRSAPSELAQTLALIDETWVEAVIDWKFAAPGLDLFQRGGFVEMMSWHRSRMLPFLLPVLGATLSTVALAQTRDAPATAPASMTDDPVPAPSAAPPPATAPTPAASPEQLPPATQPYAPPPATQPYTPPPGYKLIPLQEGRSRSRDPYQREQAELPYYEDEPIPPGYRVVERKRRGLIIAGAVVTGVAWSLSATAAVGVDYQDNSGFLLVPVLGPWLMLASGGAKDDCTREPGSDLQICEDRAGLRGVLVFDGITQAAGATMLLIGLFVPSKRLVRDYKTLRVVPMRLGRNGHGVGLVGTF